MPKDKLTEYSATNASNTDVGGINIDEGMLPSAVNNALREVLTHLKNFASGTDGIDVLSLADDDASAAMKLQAPASVTSDTTLTLPDGDGDSGQTLITNGSGTLAWAAPYGNRNLIINGAMQVAQRGTSETSVTSGGYKQAPDRWIIAGSSAGTWTVSQSSTVPSGEGFSYSYKLDCTTADASLSAGDHWVLAHYIEAQNVAHLGYSTSSAKKITLSFWVRSAKTGTYVLEIVRNDSDRHIAQTYTISSADTWEHKTLTFDADTGGSAIPHDNGRGFEINFWLAAGSTFSGGTLATSWATKVAANRAAGVVNLADSTSNDWYVTGVQLEVGETATPFEHRSFADELARCQRYFQTLRGQDRYPGDVGHPEVVFGSANLLQTPMRAQPSLSVSGALSFDEYYVSGRTQSSGHVARNSGNTQCVIASFSNFSSMTRGNPGAIYNADIDIDAEL